MEPSKTPTHFEGKEAIEHVINVQTRGKLASQEIHGAETPGHISSAADAARDTSVVYLLISVLFMYRSLPQEHILPLTALFTLGWITWKMGRSAWLGWMRLERLHRLVSEEKWEIEHHREQERDELRVLYRAKGFEGKLLEDVLNVLMADSDRLLLVMLEEELGLTLEKQEHPLKQGLGAGLGALFAFTISACLFVIVPSYGLIIGAFLTIAVAGWVSAHFEKNRRIAATLWNLGLATIAFSMSYFTYSLLFGPLGVT